MKLRKPDRTRLRARVVFENDQYYAIVSGRYVRSLGESGDQFAGMGKTPALALKDVALGLRALERVAKS